MTRNTERGIWVGVILLLLAIGTVIAAGPATRVLAICQAAMGDAMMGSSGGQTGGQRGER